MTKLFYSILFFALLAPCVKSADPLPAVIHGHRLPPEPDPKVNSVGYKHITAFAGVMV